MKNVLDFAKANLISVICVLVAVVAVPVMLFFSMGWRTSILEEVAKEASDVQNKIKRASSVNYEIPSADPNAEGWSDSHVPHQQLTDEIVAILEAKAATTDSVRASVLAYNQQGRLPLVHSGDPEQQLFPSPLNNTTRVRLTEHALEVVWPQAYQQLLDDVSFGTTVDPEELYETLLAVQAAEQARNQQVSTNSRGNENDDASKDVEAEITRKLTQERVRAYATRAEQLKGYADLSVFAGVQFDSDVVESLPSVEEMWASQMLYWVHQDLIAAIGTANSPYSSVVEAPVKRVVGLHVHDIDAGPNELPASAGGSTRHDTSRSRPGPVAGGRGGPMEAGPSVVTANLASPIGRVYSAAHTGRAGFPGSTNGYFDVRYATMDVVVDANRVGELIDAIERTNMMTVLSVSYELQDPQADLAQGYVYGGSVVAAVRLTVETLWLRDWVGEYMPDAVRAELGFEPRPEPASEDDSEQF